MLPPQQCNVYKHKFCACPLPCDPHEAFESGDHWAPYTTGAPGVFVLRLQVVGMWP